MKKQVSWLNKKRDGEEFEIKPAGAYLDSLREFGELLGDLNKVVLGVENPAKPKADENETAAISHGYSLPAGDRETVGEPAGKPAGDVSAGEPEEEKPDLNALLKELDELVGLEKVKENVKSLVNLVKVRKLREKNGLVVPPISLHMVFMGNPGTGKTTVARLMGKIYNAIGVLSKGQLVEVDRSGLVAGYVGQTAQKTAQVIEKAKGGVLFIDEAYALTSKEGNDFGDEAVETLLKAMEDNRHDLVVIVAGYDDLMREFIDSNPGLKSRFNRYFYFEDYSGEELFEIFEMQCRKNMYKLDEIVRKRGREIFEEMYRERGENFGNGRDVRNLFENAVSAHSDRVAAMENPSREDLEKLMPEDLIKGFERLKDM